MEIFWLVKAIRLLFSSYTVLLFARIVLSWIPTWRYPTFTRFICFYTDPYLNIFRRLLPPLGGVLDLSPILAFLVLRLAEGLIIRLVL
jgi:YggT family protein